MPLASEPDRVILLPSWTGVRVVEGTGLENRQTGNGFEGSNPSLSAEWPAASQWRCSPV